LPVVVNESIGLQRKLVIVALAWNALLATFWIVGGGSDGAVIAAMYAAPPILLLALLRHPRAFSFAAAALGLAYAFLVATAFSAWLVLMFSPATLCLLSAALLPWLSSRPAARRRRRTWFLGAMAAAVFASAAALVLLAT
jgi:hypothetical protein